jgi:hypothetical protein
VPARVIGEAWLRLRRYADLRCLDAGFLAVVSLAPFLPWIGISISFWPADALRVFLSGFAGGEDALPILWRNASIKSTTFSPRGRALAVTNRWIRAFVEILLRIADLIGIAQQRAHQSAMTCSRLVSTTRPIATLFISLMVSDSIT